MQAKGAISDLGILRLSDLLEKNESFSFLRLGDGEIRFLIENQESQWRDDRYDIERPASCELATGTLGLRAQDYQRLLRSYEECDGLDLYLCQEYNRISIDEIKWARNSAKWTISIPEECGIINRWTQFEFKKYTSKHKSLICGAEAHLLKELILEPEYRKIACDYLSESKQLCFYEPPNRGKNLSQNLEKIKQDIKNFILNEKCDTVFISLGGPAKILCYEIAAEIGVRAIDWGSMIRALTYSGSDGQSSWRASHNPFFFRIPLPLYYRCIKRAWPSLSLAEILGKSHAQLCLELQRKMVGISSPADVHDPSTFDDSSENQSEFFKAWKFYRREILPLVEGRSEMSLVREFEMWRLKKGVGFKGQLFLLLLKIKAILRRLNFFHRSIFNAR